MIISAAANEEVEEEEEEEEEEEGIFDSWCGFGGEDAGICPPNSLEMSAVLSALTSPPDLCTDPK